MLHRTKIPDVEGSLPGRSESVASALQVPDESFGSLAEGLAGAKRERPPSSVVDDQDTNPVLGGAFGRRQQKIPRRQA